MKKNLIVTKTTCLAIFALATASTSMAATLVNGGFESAAAPGAPTGWSLNLSGATGVTSTTYARSGTQSLVIDSTGAGQWASPNVSQSFAAAPGEEFSFQGYMLRSGSIAGGSFGILKMEFRDAANATLEPPGGTISIGAFAFGGVESLPRLIDANVGQDTWLFTEARAIAPAGTTSVGFFVLNVNQTENTMYFDDISVTLIPEPSALALTGLGLACFVGFRRRK
jgi:PEP-CTERM motif